MLINRFFRLTTRTLDTFRRNWRTVLIYIGILATFVLVPTWYRPPRPPFIPDTLYVTRFVQLYTMLFTIGAALLFGRKQLGKFLQHPLRRTWAFVMLALVVWIWASTSWAFRRVENPEVATTAALQLSVVLVFSVVVASMDIDPRWIIGVLVVTMLIHSGIIIAQAQNQAHLDLQWLGEFPVTLNQPGVSVLQGGGGRWLRPHGLLPHPNMAAGTVVLSLFACGVWVLSDRLWLRWLGTIAMVLGFWALLVTFSRGAWLGFAVGALAVLPRIARTWRNRRDKQLHLVGTIGVLVVVGLLFVGTYLPLLVSRTGLGDANVEVRSVADRIVFTSFALRAIDESPIVGLGIGNFPWRSSFFIAETFYDLQGNHVHHVYLSAWAELGIVGYGLVLVALGLGIEISLRRKTNIARTAMLAGVMALVVIGLFDHYTWTAIQSQVAWWGLLAVAMGNPSGTETNPAPEENIMPKKPVVD